MRLTRIDRKVVAGLAAIVLVVVAVLASWASRPGPVTELKASPAELGGGYMTGADCQARLAAGTTGLSAHAVAWLQDCAEALGGPNASPTDVPSPVPTTATPSPSGTTTSPSPSPTVSPTASPTMSPSPSPTATGPLRNCAAQLAACGLPHAGNTGPTGTLTPSSRTQYTTAGETVANVSISGCVEVRATNVTFRNVRIAGSCFYAVRNYSTGLSIVDSELTCNGFNGSAVTASNYSLTRVDIHHCENGLNVGGNVSMVDSWIHDMETDDGAHTDGAQINQGATNVVIRHNTIVVPTPGATSAIISWNEASPQQQQVVIDGNLLSGGTYVLYCPREGASDTRVVNNRFADPEYGYSERCTGSHVSVWAGNVIDSTGAALAAA